eukprot:TRINITY_DN17219_c0_g1_i1.p1 TRINITY_DN17219_c0_g1~~TRINITY_DN17219_c0_g1_i1.p1  ORF type:complete len:280 (-),score=82.55 TRINITY_DN17219_c0_g1_i1:54-893(-)
MIAAQLAEKRRIAAAGSIIGGSKGGSMFDGLGGGVGRGACADVNKTIAETVAEMASRREADMAARRDLISNIEDMARLEAEQLVAWRAAEEPEELQAAKRALAAGQRLRACPGGLGSCAMCSLTMEERDARRLPCGHSFHFGCIDDFHRKKMRDDNDVSLPCFTCGVASNRSIASVVEDRKQKREAEAAQALAAARAAKAKEDAAKHAADIATTTANKRPSVRTTRGPSPALSNAMTPAESAESGEACSDRFGSARRAGSQRRGRGALAALARAAHGDE